MKKLREVRLEIIANKSKDQVWDLLFNRFGEVNVFNPLIEGSHHTSGQKGEVGCERKCDIDSRNSVVEKIVEARGEDSFDVDIIEGGLPMMDEMKATFDLQALGENQTKVSLTMKYSTKPAFMAGLMKGKMSNMLFTMLIGLKYHLETDKFVTKGNIKDIIKDHKQLKGNEAFIHKQKMAMAS